MKADSKQRDADCRGRISRIVGTLGVLAVPAMVVLAILVLAMVVAACADLTDTSSASTGGSETTVLETTTLAPTSESTTTSAPEPTTTTVGSLVSAESTAYAASIGGADHYGETLYFVIGCSVATEAQAQAQLEPAKAVGDMQSYFIVQLSDNFDGMRAGYWVVFEAYRSYPDEYDLEFCRRPFPDCYVKRATVMTHDPIPIVRE